MPGVPRQLTKHTLNVDPKYKPVKQFLRRFNKERRKEELNYAYYTPAINNAQSARNIIQEKYESYVNGGISDIETFIKDTTSQVETSIQRQ